jgi:hypothetical protein
MAQNHIGAFVFQLFFFYLFLKKKATKIQSASWRMKLLPTNLSHPRQIFRPPHLPMESGCWGSTLLLRLLQKQNPLHITELFAVLSFVPYSKQLLLNLFIVFTGNDCLKNNLPDFLKIFYQSCFISTKFYLCPYNIKLSCGLIN